MKLIYKYILLKEEIEFLKSKYAIAQQNYFTGTCVDIEAMITEKYEEMEELMENIRKAMGEEV